MKNGKRILIRGIPWKFIVGRPPGNKCDGMCCYDIRTIYVRKTATDPIATAVHEVLHACFPDVEEGAIIDTEEAIMAALEALH